jgi:metallo-beta-lactamase class B
MIRQRFLKFSIMRDYVNTLLVITLSLSSLSCSSQKHPAFKSKKIYVSENLIINQIAENSFQHTSFKQTNDFGNVPCNGMIVRNGKEVLIFDTPTSDKVSEALIQWIRDTLQCSINAVIPTHFHDDCLGGLEAFHAKHIPSYAHVSTIALAKANDETVPQNGFSDSLRLQVGNATITARYFGEGHTKDNVVGYFPAERVLFGGCLVKELDASKGYLGDANLSAWSATVERVKQAYPHVQLVVPGHGAHGDKALLDYTIQLFKTP